MRLSGQISIAAVLGTVPAFTFCEASRASADHSTALDQFQRFVALEGDWRIVGGDRAQGATHNDRTIAGGNAEIETDFSGQPHEMVTIYHFEGMEMEFSRISN